MALFWIIYLLSVLLISLYLSRYSSKNLRLYVFILVLVTLITPTRINVGEAHLAPALSVFIFDLVFEQNLSILSLRPLVLSFPLGLILAFLITKTKKRFSGV